jgi:hypothetical protein
MTVSANDKHDAKQPAPQSPERPLRPDELRAFVAKLELESPTREAITAHGERPHPLQPLGSPQCDCADCAVWDRALDTLYAAYMDRLAAYHFKCADLEHLGRAAAQVEAQYAAPDAKVLPFAQTTCDDHGGDDAS